MKRPYIRPLLTFMKKDLDYLDDVFSRLTPVEAPLDDATRKQLWERISHDTLENRRLQADTIRLRKRLHRVSVAAAVALLCTAGFFTLRPGAEESINYDAVSQYCPHDIEHVQLVIPDRVIPIRNAGSVVYNGNKVVADGVAYDIKNPDEIHQFIVPFGETAGIRLADGSKVTLNSGSKLIYKSGMGGARRQVYVNGEVFLDVFRDESRPFTVKTNRLNVHVLGTEFDVRAYDDEDAQSVILISGSVSVGADLLDQRYRIVPDQCFSYNTSNCDISIRQVPVENYISWMDGILIFDNANLKDVFKSVIRHYDVEILYDSSLENIRISGKLDIRGSVEDTLQSIGLVAGTKYVCENGKYRISAK